MADRNDPPVRNPSRRARVRLLATGAVAAVLGIAAAVLYGTDEAGKRAPAACPGGEASAAKLRPLARGEVAALGLKDRPGAAPALVFNGPDGRPMSLSDFRGRTVLVNLWATWCVPCRREMPALDRLQAKLGGADFAVVAINVDTAKLDRPKTFLKDNAIAALPFYADPSADVLQVLKGEGALVGLPTTLLIDRNGCELGVMAGPADWASDDAVKLIEAAKI